MNSNRRRTVLKHLAAGLLGSLGFSALSRYALAYGAKPITVGMHKITGNVTINGKPAEPGVTIEAGDTVVTGPSSVAIYVIGQDAFLQRENSQVNFAGAAANVIRLLNGKLLAVFGKGQKKLETATATIGIRGTGCYLESEANRTYFCLCYGAAEITPTAAPGQIKRIETRHHDHPIYINHDATHPTFTVATVTNHGDAELELLESLVGRWPPFSQGSYRY